MKQELKCKPSASRALLIAPSPLHRRFLTAPILRLNEALISYDCIYDIEILFQWQKNVFPAFSDAFALPRFFAPDFRADCGFRRVGSAFFSWEVAKSWRVSWCFALTLLWSLQTLELENEDVSKKRSKTHFNTLLIEVPRRLQPLSGPFRLPSLPPPSSFLPPPSLLRLFLPPTFWVSTSSELSAF